MQPFILVEVYYTKSTIGYEKTCFFNDSGDNDDFACFRAD